jgi:hypothetical protein
LSYRCFNAGCGKSDLAKAVATFNQTWVGMKALNGATIPQLILPPDYSLGTPIFSQDSGASIAARCTVVGTLSLN